MLSIPFRQQHLLRLLTDYEQHTQPLDYFMSVYFRTHKALGSKDRAYISEIIYGLIRWKGLYDFILGDRAGWPERLALFFEKPAESYLSDWRLPLHIRYSVPESLFREMVDSFGEEKAKEICLASNFPAPTTVRVNTQKITRQELLDKFLAHGFDVSCCKESTFGIRFHKKIHFFGLPEFKEGYFEVQDEASQLVAEMLAATPQQRILDFCSGSGGKTLAFAPKLAGTGQIYLHDVRLSALHEARERLKRAGIQNAQIIHSTELDKLKKLKKQMDWVLVDAPCSGTGTLRRNPDMKWKFSIELLERLVSQQRVIFEQALSYLKPNGTIIYATCSLLKRENQDQVAHFLKTYALEMVGEPFQSIPEQGMKDGFFAVCFRRKALV